MGAAQYQVITIFPELFSSFLSTSLVSKAIESKQAAVKVVNLRDFADPPHFKVDDTPYGGGAGMVMRPEPLARAIKACQELAPKARKILLTPAGQPFSQKLANELKAEDELIFICGRYEGIDQRIVDSFVDLEISIGDYVLMGGELPAQVVIESVLRLRDNVIGNRESLNEESFSIHADGSLLLEGPHYTKPAAFEGQSVPSILLSGDHQKIAAWRNAQARAKTARVRPDLKRKD